MLATERYLHTLPNTHNTALTALHRTRDTNPSHTRQPVSSRSPTQPLHHPETSTPQFKTADQSSNHPQAPQCEPKQP
ncbi:hypothetical protein GCM10027563_17660 [Parasphingorhabdus pacifica]